MRRWTWVVHHLNPLSLAILGTNPSRASLVAQMVKNLPKMQETWVRSLGWEDPLEKGMATHSSILAWKSYGQMSLEGYSLWGHKELYIAKHTHPFQFQFLVLTGLPSFAISLETHRSTKCPILSLPPAQLLTCMVLLGGLPPPTQGSVCILRFKRISCHQFYCRFYHESSTFLFSLYIFVTSFWDLKSVPCHYQCCQNSYENF